MIFRTSKVILYFIYEHALHDFKCVIKHTFLTNTKVMLTCEDEDLLVQWHRCDPRGLQFAPSSVNKLKHIQ